MPVKLWFNVMVLASTNFFVGWLDIVSKILMFVSELMSNIFKNVELETSMDMNHVICEKYINYRKYAMIF